MKTIIKTLIILTLLTSLSACSSISSLTGISSEGTESAPISAPNEDESENDDIKFDSNPPDEACLQEDILVVVNWNKTWTWSPDGTEATGGLDGQAIGNCRLLLSQDKDGNLDGDSCEFEYSQKGTIQGDPGQCSVEGVGWASLTLSGVCQDGAMELEWMEVGTELQNTSMKCDGKDYEFVMIYPAQAVFGVEVPVDGWAYYLSENTILPLFRDVHMEWDIRLVPEGHIY